MQKRFQIFSVPAPILMAIVSLAMAVFPAMDLSAETRPPGPAFFFEGLIGKDDRIALDATTSPFNAIGKLNVSGFSALRQCTGFLVAPDVVATAAHCVTSVRTGRTLAPGRFHFLPGWQRQKFLAHGIAKCIKVADGFVPRRKPTLEDMARDVAIIILKEPMTIMPMEMDVNAVLTPKSAILHAGYSRDRAHLLSGDPTCSIVEVQEATVFTNCDTNRGASGGPVMALGSDDKFRTVAMMVGGFSRKSNVAVKLPVLLDLMKDASCD